MWRLLAGQLMDGGTCRVAVSAIAASTAKRHCGEPAAALVEYGCEHEHVSEEPELVCARHRDLLTGGAAGCAKCWLGPPHSRHESHRCRLLGRVVGVTDDDEEDEPGLVG